MSIFYLKILLFLLFLVKIKALRINNKELYVN
jgi:hypothetical protein